MVSVRKEKTRIQKKGGKRIERKSWRSCGIGFIWTFLPPFRLFSLLRFLLSFLFKRNEEPNDQPRRKEREKRKRRKMLKQQLSFSSSPNLFFSSFSPILQLSCRKFKTYKEHSVVQIPKPSPIYFYDLNFLSAAQIHKIYNQYFWLVPISEILQPNISYYVGRRSHATGD